MLPPLLPGHILRDRYRICQVVGQGGMGCVYQAEDLRLTHRLCAVKEIQPDVGDSEDARHQAQDQFHREASTLARLDHPNLPKVSDFFSEGDRVFLVMDYVPGHDLKEIMDASRREGLNLPERRVLDWAQQLCEALQYLHNQNPPVLHRDIKPGNIKLTPGGLLKLVDFGLVKLLEPDDTRTVTVIQGRGTALYTPLEQYGGDNGHTDSRSDIYSLGATLYHLLTNTPPLEAKQRFLDPSKFEHIKSLQPDVSDTTATAIEWAMGLHPDQRPESVEAFQGVMTGVDEFQLRPSTFGDQTWADAVRKNKGLFAVFVLLVLATLAATLVSVIGASP